MKGPAVGPAPLRPRTAQRGPFYVRNSRAFTISTTAPAAPTIKLLVADDRLVVREGLKRLVAECSDMTVVGEAATRDEVLERTRATEPDVLLLDLFLGTPTILGLIRAIKRDQPRCHVLVLNVQGEDADALRILGTGAAGYLSKDHSRRQLIDAIRQVARGGSYVSPSLANTLIAGLGGSRRTGHDALSHREYQVLCMFGSGIAFKQIAAELGVSPKTVSTYRSRILDKLKLRSNAALIRYAIEHQLVPSSITPPARRQKSTTDP
jgi:two-component system, NarL family, invasion response regulator UvrY